MGDIYRDVFRVVEHFVESQSIKCTRAYRFYDALKPYLESATRADSKPSAEGDTMLAEFSRK